LQFAHRLKDSAAFALTSRWQHLHTVCQPSALCILGIKVEECCILIHELAAADIHGKPAMRTITHVMLARRWPREAARAVQALRPADDLGHAVLHQALEVDQILLVGNQEAKRVAGPFQMTAKLSKGTIGTNRGNRHGSGRGAGATQSKQANA
jgi:hypothetical protein